MGREGPLPGLLALAASLLLMLVGLVGLGRVARLLASPWLLALPPMAAAAVALIARGRRPVCIELKSSRLAPRRLMAVDAAYLARLVRALSIDYGEAWLEAPGPNGGALLCARGARAEFLRRLVAESRTLVVVAAQARSGGRCRVYYYQPGRLAESLRRLAPPGARVALMKPVPEDVEGWDVVDLSGLLTMRARLERLAAEASKGPVVVVDPIDVPPRLLEEILGEECLVLVRSGEPYPRSE